MTYLESALQDLPLLPVSADNKIEVAWQTLLNNDQVLGEPAESDLPTETPTPSETPSEPTATPTPTPKP
jgi:hypothetical protein